MTRSARFCANAAVIAAIYAGLTLLLSPLSFGALQVRASEALVALAAFSPAAIPGLAVGCFLANMLGPGGIIDAVIGTAATLLGALAMYLLKNKPAFLAITPNVLINGIAVSLELTIMGLTETAFLPCFLWICAGEAIACYGLGLTLHHTLSGRQELLEKLK